MTPTSWREETKEAIARLLGTMYEEPANGRTDAEIDRDVAEAALAAVEERTSREWRVEYVTRDGDFKRVGVQGEGAGGAAVQLAATMAEEVSVSGAQSRLVSPWQPVKEDESDGR